MSRRFPGLSLMRADFAAHEFAPHTHDAFVIAVTEAGGAEISSRGMTGQIGADTLFVSNPEERPWIERALLTLLGVEGGMASDQLFEGGHLVQSGVVEGVHVEVRRLHGRSRLQ